MTAHSDEGPHDTTDRIAGVHIDRLVLRNVDLGPHEIRSLSHRIAEQLTHNSGRRAVDDGLRGPGQIAAEIAHRVRVTIERQPPGPP